MWYWIKTPIIVKKIFRNQVWDIPSNKNSIYLTFDDGPTPGLTDKILSILSKHNAKATFFCVGKIVCNKNTNTDIFCLYRAIFLQ